MPYATTRLATEHNQRIFKWNNQINDQSETGWPH